MSLGDAIIATFVMGGIIFLCRVFPFLFFRNTDKNSASMNRILSFVERTVPPVAMTVLTFNALSVPIKEDMRTSLPLLIAVIFTVLVHIWKRNFLISIFGGTSVFILVGYLWH